MRSSAYRLCRLRRERSERNVRASDKFADSPADDLHERDLRNATIGTMALTVQGSRLRKLGKLRKNEMRAELIFQKRVRASRAIKGKSGLKQRMIFLRRHKTFCEISDFLVLSFSAFPPSSSKLFYTK